MNFALNKVTMLIDYFSLNSRDVEAKQYLYVEILRYYTFKKEKKSMKGIYLVGKSHYNCIGRV